VDLGVGQGHPDPVGVGGVGVGAEQALDEPVEAEPAQLVGHLRGGMGGADQTGDKSTPAPVGEAGTAWTSGALPGRWLGTHAR
jgi:hypothetical protein